MCAIAVLARCLKIDAEKTRVLWLDRDAEQLALRGRGVRDCWIAAHLSTEVGTVLANTEAPMRSTRSYSGQHLVQGVVYRGSLFRIELVHGAHQNFERIACRRSHAHSRVRMLMLARPRAVAPRIAIDARRDPRDVNRALG